MSQRDHFVRRLDALRAYNGWPTFPGNILRRLEVVEEMEELLDEGFRVPAVLSPLAAIYEANNDLESKLEVLEMLVEADPRDPRHKSNLKATKKRIENPTGYAAEREKEVRRIQRQPSWIPQRHDPLDI